MHSHTWRYVNKSGGPDRRFKDNVQLPVMNYAELRLRSGSGLDEAFHISNIPAAAQFVAAIGGVDAAKEGREHTFVAAPDGVPGLLGAAGRTGMRRALGWIAGLSMVLVLGLVALGALLASQAAPPETAQAKPNPASHASPSPATDHERLLASPVLDRGLKLRGFVQSAGRTCLSPARPFYQGLVVDKNGGMHWWNLQCDAQHSFAVLLPASKEPRSRQVVPCGTKLAARCFQAFDGRTALLRPLPARAETSPRVFPSRAPR